MKAFIVVALVLLCGAYAARFRTAKDFSLKKKATRDDTSYLKLKPNPCAFGFKYEANSQHGSYSGEFKYYNGCQLDAQKGDNSVFYQLKRMDIPEEGTDNVLFVTAAIENNACSVYGASSTSKYSTVGNCAWFGLATDVECSEITETTWEGQKCTNCTYSENYDPIKRDYYYRSYFVKDGHIIGFADSYGETVKVTEYIYKDFRDDFALPNDCTYEPEPLPAAVHSAPPEDKECKTENKVVKLKELPCSFGIKFKQLVGGDYEGVYRRYGMSEMEVDFDGDYNYTSMVRADIPNPDVKDSALYVWAYNSVDYCGIDDTGYGTPKPGSVDTYFTYYFYAIYDKELYCNGYDETIWKEKKCKCCTTRLGLDALYLYVEDELIIGASAPTDFGSFGLEYIFEDMRNEFALNRSCEGATVPDQVYSVPSEVKDCGHKPKGGDAASTISVVATMIISMVMITLISLF